MDWFALCCPVSLCFLVVWSSTLLNISTIIKGLLFANFILVSCHRCLSIKFLWICAVSQFRGYTLLQHCSFAVKLAHESAVEDIILRLSHKNVLLIANSRAQIPRLSVFNPCQSTISMAWHHSRRMSLSPQCEVIFTWTHGARARHLEKKELL